MVYPGHISGNGLQLHYIDTNLFQAIINGFPGQLHLAVVTNRLVEVPDAVLASVKPLLLNGDLDLPILHNSCRAVVSEVDA